MTRREVFRHVPVVAFLTAAMGQLRIHLRAQRTPPVAGATLWVDGVNGNDNNTIAQVRAGGGSVAWQTIWRAAWGSTDRAAPNASEAAAAGDVVSIASGTYESTVNLGSRSAVLYTPVNQGTAGNPIRFVANGVVTLVARTLNGPIIGSDSQDYIEWYADVTQGHKWSILNDYVLDGTSAVGTVNIVSDTGSVVLWGANYCLIEGVEVDGNVGFFGSNYNGVRMESCIGCTVRNNIIHNFHYQNSDADSSCVHMYGGQDNIVEHNEFYDANTVVRFKDTGTTISPMQNNHIRYNYIHHWYNAALGTSLLTELNEGTNYFYQNLCINSYSTGFGIMMAGTESNDYWYNNTFYNVAYGCNPGLGVGARYWNNIWHTVVNNVIFSDGGPGVATTAIDCQHNVYYNYSGDFYNCTDGVKTFAQWKSSYSGQEATSPISINDDPVFVTAGSNFHLNQGTSPCLALGRHPISGDTIPAGCYITGSETIGRVT